ncbi:hypothetical protein NQ318_014598 [Aromia moschata]|uniref:Transposase n=1 Tax=Aromia moschata TaxID=1265417 RepID=A0AAV8ZAR5_9CUCU|nr:hypothetical protein NQ318_014598 [Aromia moschata]
MNHISVLEIYLDKLVYHKLLCTELSNNILHQDIHFQKKIIFTDEACFTRRGITNLHNYHEYSDVNLHSVTPRHFQSEFKINVWIGVIDRYLIGPVPNRLNGETYLKFLQNTFPDLLDEVLLQLRLEHDGAPSPFSIIIQINGLDEEIIAYKFGLHDHQTSTNLRSEKNCGIALQINVNVIRNNNLLERIDFNFRRRINLCLRENGDHFEQFL